MKKFYFIVTVFLLFCFCRKENKNKESLINSQLAYPMTIEEVVKKIGQPDSITSEKHDFGSLGVGVNTIYHYGTHHLIFSPHGIYMGEKSTKKETLTNIAK
jgi:hypothetical protein